MNVKNLFKLTLLLLVAILPASLWAESYSGKCGENLTWTLSDGTLTISGTGEMEFVSGNKEWKQYRDLITKVNIEDGVKSISRYAFYNCVNLRDVSIAESVEYIGEKAFCQCIGITSITLPRSIQTYANVGIGIFDGCSGIKDVTVFVILDNFTNLTSVFGKQVEHYTIGGGSTTVPKMAFWGCEELKSIKFPSSLRTIGERAFAYCKGLVKVDLEEGLETIEENAFENCEALTIFHLPSTVKEIGDRAFYACTLLDVQIPASLRSIGERAFQNCTNIKEIVIPEGLTSISFFAFGGCESVTRLTLPKSLVKIESYAFYKCINLENVNIPENVESLGDVKYASAAFGGCTNLKEVTINSQTLINNSDHYHYPSQCFSLNKVFEYAEHFIFDGNITEIIDYTLRLNKVVKKVTLSDKITKIGKAAFQDCINLEECVLPNSLVLISKEIFSRCSSLSNIQLPETVQIIDTLAFTGCTSLTELVLPESLTTIKSQAFRNTDITKILIPSSVTELADDSFVMLGLDKGCKLKEVELYSNCVNSYPRTFGKQVEKYVLGDKITEIPDRAFDHAENIKTIELSDTIENMGEYAFSNCPKLSSINIPERLTTISKGLFYGCQSITNIVIPEGIKTIGQYAFQGCDLTSIVIPANIESIKSNAFDVKEVTINSNAIASAGGDERDHFAGIFGSQVKKYIFGEGVTKIGARAFYGNEELQSVALPESVNEIGEYAFASCGKLAEVNLPKNLRVINNNLFSRCSSLSAILIPEGVTSIGFSAFSDCLSLKEITIPEGVESIDQAAFSKCTGITSIVLPTTLTSMKNAFWGNPNLKEVTLNSDVIVSEDNTHGYYHSFYDCFGEQVETVSLLGNVTKIGESAFNNMPNLKTVYIGPNVISIGRNAFQGLEKLENIVFVEGSSSEGSANTRSEGGSTLSIGYRAFSECSNLKSINVPERLEELKRGTFSGCTSLKDVKVNSNTLVSKNYETEKNFSTDYLFGKQVEHFTLGENITAIGNYSFSGCSDMESIVIPNSVKSIGESAFSGCSSLAEVIIPSSVDELGDNVFEGCNNLTTVNISEGATEIGANTLKSFTNITTFSVPSTVTSVSSGAFNDCAKLTDVYFYTDASSLQWDVADSGLRSEAIVHTPINQFSAYVSKFHLSDGNIFAGELSTLSDDGEENGAEFWVSIYCGKSNVKVNDQDVKVYAAHLNDDVLNIVEINSDILANGSSKGGFLLKSRTDVINITTTNENCPVSFTNELRGVDESTKREDVLSENNSAMEVYALRKGDSGIGFYRVEANENIAAGNAYITVNSTSAYPPMLALEYGEPSGIYNNCIDQKNVNDSWYSLDGRKLIGKTAKSGVFVRNGKTVVLYK